MNKGSGIRLALYIADNLSSHFCHLLSPHFCFEERGIDVQKIRGSKKGILEAWREENKKRANVGRRKGAGTERLMTAAFRAPVVAGRCPSRTVELSLWTTRTKWTSKKEANYASNTLVSKGFRWIPSCTAAKIAFPPNLQHQCCLKSGFLKWILFEHPVSSDRLDSLTERSAADKYGTHTHTLIVYLCETHIDIMHSVARSWGQNKLNDSRAHGLKLELNVQHSWENDEDGMKNKACLVVASKQRWMSV